MKRGIRNVLTLFLLIFTMILSIGMKNQYIGIFAEDSNKPIYKVSKEEKELALTFDINWAENDELYNILDVLDKYNVKATFFIMGGWVNYSEENKEKLKKINEGGHEIGNHSYIHPMFTKINEERMKSELEKTNKIIKDTIGVDVNLFRFPSGDYNKKSIEFVKSNGYEIIQWNIDSIDWKQLGEEKEYNNVMKKIEPGSIILFHNNAKYTPKNLDKIIKKLQEEGYSFIPVGKMIYNSDDSYINENGEQIKK